MNVNTLPTSVKIIGVVLLLVVITLLVRVVLKAIRIKNHRIQTILTLTYSLVQYVAFIVGLAWCLSIAGVDVNMILASVGVVALIVGFSAESLIEDVITGLFMIFENQFNVGDVVEVDNYRGTVENIGIRTISLRDSGDNIKIVNNSNIKNMINLSTSTSRAVCDIRVSYDEDLVKVEGLIEKLLSVIYEEHRNVFLQKPEYIGVQDMDLNSLVLRVVVEVEEEKIFSGRRILNRELYLGLENLGIHMPRYTKKV
ncbi:MAG: mechanosensitive ion channel family protein [Clostridiales bacterium]|nr:mechanosensitive ion channel family protein [Clostridiales bacterium]